MVWRLGFLGLGTQSKRQAANLRRMCNRIPTSPHPLQATSPSPRSGHAGWSSSGRCHRHDSGSFPSSLPCWGFNGVGFTVPITPITHGLFEITPTRQLSCIAAQTAASAVCLAGPFREGPHVAVHAVGLAEGVLKASRWAGPANVSGPLAIAESLGEVARVACRATHRRGSVCEVPS